MATRNVDKETEPGAAALKISYFSKEDYTCPVCAEKFKREELLSGSGRLIAGDLTDEMHRLYEPSARYGLLYPLAYLATVCPKCLFASMDSDFTKLPRDKREQAFQDAETREKELTLLTGDAAPGGVDFYESRTLVSGAMSQYLVLRCYDYYPSDFSPAIKQALAGLRAGWLFDDLDKKLPNQHFDWLAGLFKKKAALLYAAALKLETAGKENISTLTNMGPDTDKNYGYEGILYMTAFLEYKYGDTADSQRRQEALSENKRNLAKMFGLGKSSKSKPGPLLERSRELYEALGKELGEIDV